MAGRAVLIKNVLIAIPLYYMFVFCISESVAQKITAMQSRSLWGGAGQRQ
jgi:hypothetical protein